MSMHTGLCTGNDVLMSLRVDGVALAGVQKQQQVKQEQTGLTDRFI